MTQAYHTLRFWTVIIGLSIVMSSLCIGARLIDRSGDLSHRISSFWGRLLCRLNGIRVEVEGLEHIRPDRAQILIANHQGFFDIFGLSGYLPIQLRWVAKASLFRIPFVGWSMRASGYIPVERDSRKKAHQAFMASIEKLKAGYSIVIFPEGTRSADGIIGPFKKGSHLMAMRARVPMVPVTLIGSGRIIRKGSGAIRPGPIRIIIGKPVEYEVIAAKKEESVLEALRETICANYRLHAPTPPPAESEGKPSTGV
ncbi:lysophospholipid acyltransferase family protein [Nitrospina watsonii]|uniref:1-acyl-sn-glycerol-3-phosphate acyltransferase n=1 Tax=Nitrospina watsonii TaxID=1323948 RepID=A0ABN8W1S1_9BACT|nr:lysophospholipid acyltransferase family protein [Nitrospina watsonii]CAI2718854.1 1-acyl-sn-glycerol-3-phosphate acyltransferase [Nitrospina watsonii]